MENFLIQLWIVINCVGTQIGSVVVPLNQCVEPKFGLAFKTNGTYIFMSNNCSQTEHVNIVQCSATDPCCYVPDGLSVNVSLTSQSWSKNETHGRGPYLPTPLPEPSAGRRFVCTEQDI